jgi:hypothetical protein
MSDEAARRLAQERFSWPTWWAHPDPARRRTDDPIVMEARQLMLDSIADVPTRPPRKKKR